MTVVGERKREAAADVRVRRIFSQRSTRSKAIILIERENVDDKEVKRKGKGEDIKTRVRGNAPSWFSVAIMATHIVETKDMVIYRRVW
jgi:hypothetical protein